MPRIPKHGRGTLGSGPAIAPGHGEPQRGQRFIRAASRRVKARSPIARIRVFSFSDIQSDAAGCANQLICEGPIVLPNPRNKRPQQSDQFETERCNVKCHVISFRPLPKRTPTPTAGARRPGPGCAQRTAPARSLSAEHAGQSNHQLTEILIVKRVAITIGFTIAFTIGFTSGFHERLSRSDFTIGFHLHLTSPFPDRLHLPQSTCTFTFTFTSRRPASRYP